MTASLTTGQAGPWAGQTGYLVAQTALSIAGQSGTLELSPGFHVMTCSTDFNCYSSPVNTISHAIPYTHAICAESCYEPVQSHQVDGLAQDMRHGQKEIYSQNPVVPTHFRSLDQKDNQLRPEVSKTDLRFYDLTSIKQKYDESVIDYIKRLRDAKSRCSYLNITESDLADFAYNGLLVSIKQRLNGKVFLDVNHVLHEALA